MLGAICGDVIGSIYERWPIKTAEFPLFSERCRFTDDTALTVATADAILTDRDYGAAYRNYFNQWPDAGYGGRFFQWGAEEPEGRNKYPPPYNSFGNGSAMRVSPIGWAFNSIAEVLSEAERSAAVTHNHPEGVMGAQAVAAAVFLARTGSGKAVIKDYVERTFGYALDRTLDEIRPKYRFDVTCQGSVPQAMQAFLEGNDYEDTVRKAISLGGDSDTLAAMAGSIAEAFYGSVPADIVDRAMQVVDDRMRPTIQRFRDRYVLRA